MGRPDRVHHAAGRASRAHSPRRPRSRRPPAHLLLALAMFCATGCRAPAGDRRGIRKLALTDIDGYVEFVTRQREHEQTSKVGTADTRFEETVFEENLKLELEGYSYHPNFLEFTLGGLFGLLQQDFEDEFGGRRRTSGDSGTVVEFDLEGRFFKKKDYPGSIFARRYQALEPRPFQPSFETTTTNLGLHWQYVSEKVPTSFQFSHTDVLFDPLGGMEEEGQQTNTLLRFETGYRFSESNVLSFVYTRDSVEQRPFNLDYDSDEVTLSHRLDFGQDHQHRLESELNFFDQRGSFSIERVRWREVLRLWHSETLRSWYQFEAGDRTQGSIVGVPAIEEETLYLAATIEHELYESLVSQAFGFVQRQEFGTGARIDRAAAQASFDYRKKNRWGALQASYVARLQREDRTGGAVLGEITDERRTFQDPEPVVLATPEISGGSIVVTALDGITFYRVGRDYLVRRIGDRVELERVVTGRIQDGETVLVDYVFSVGGDLSLDTVFQNFSLRQSFDFGLAPYYRLRWQDQTLSPPSARGATPEDITAHILGVEFRRGPFRLVAEYEDHESTINPFEAVRLSGDYTHRFKFGATGVLQARWSDFDYQPPNQRQTRFFTVEGRYRHPITPELTVEGVVVYRDETDTLSGDDEGIDVDLTLEWFVRQTEVRVTYEFGRIEDTFARNDYSALYVQVRRRF